MLSLLLTSLALAGGGGAYVELDPGLAVSDATTSLARAWSGSFELGGYGGPYRGSMRYGRYSRVGLRLSWAGTEVAGSRTDLIHHVQPLITFGMGTDVVDVGAFWTVGAGPVAVLDARLGRVDYGGGGRATVGGMYNLGRSFGAGLRLEAGADALYRVDEARIDVSLTASVGLVVLFRIPVKTPRDEYPDPVPLEDP
jgi:hypothetical protein